MYFHHDSLQRKFSISFSTLNSLHESQCQHKFFFLLMRFHNSFISNWLSNTLYNVARFEHELQIKLYVKTYQWFQTSDCIDRTHHRQKKHIIRTCWTDWNVARFKCFTKSKINRITDRLFQLICVRESKRKKWGEKVNMGSNVSYENKKKINLSAGSDNLMTNICTWNHRFSAEKQQIWWSIPYSGSTNPCGC